MDYFLKKIHNQSKLSTKKRTNNFVKLSIEFFGLSAKFNWIECSNISHKSALVWALFLQVYK